MKKLICAKDVEDLAKKGQKIFYIEENTIITPSAKDSAKALKIEFSTDSNVCEVECEAKTSCEAGIDSNMIFEVFKAMADKGLLQGLFDNTPAKPYVADQDPSGLKIIRGNSVKYDYFDTGDSSVQAHYQEIISKDESSMSAGFLTIDHSKFDWELCYEEIDYVIEGTLCVTINGKKYTAHAGDVLFVPSGSKVVWESPDKAKLFYVTYPANWADLMA